MSRWRFIVGLVCAAGLVASAAPPTLDHLYPAGGQQGTTVTVNIVGKTDPWPVKVWTDTPGLAFTPDKDKGKLSVAIAKDAPPGPHLVRLYNDEGASTLRFFLVSQTVESLDTEPNDAFAKPQSIDTLPKIVNGRLDRNSDVDSFAINLDAGERLIAALDAYRLASTMDATLRLVDTNGTTLAFNHDDATFDPVLTWQAPRKGTYVVQVMAFPFPANASVNLAGGPGYIYRLTLTKGPWLTRAFPSAVSLTNKTSVQLSGWNLGKDASRVNISFDPKSLAKGSDQAELKWPGALNTIQVAITSTSETLEAEPNNTADKSQPIEAPGNVNGVIQEPGDEDRFTFNARKGDKFEIGLQAAALGSPLDAWLRIEDSTGKELAKDDDARESSDPQINWTAPADGKFTAIIGSVPHKGGEDWIYRLTIARAEPSFEINLAANAFAIAPGKTNEVKLTTRRRNGHDKKLTLTAKDLPAGITATPVEVPTKDGEVVLKLVANDAAKPFNGPFQVLVTEAGNPSSKVVQHELTSRGIDNGVPQGFNSLVIDKTGLPWLTVLPKPPAKTEEKK